MLERRGAVPRRPTAPRALGCPPQFRQSEGGRVVPCTPRLPVQRDGQNPQTGHLGQSEPLPASPRCLHRDWYPPVRGTRYGPACGSPELQHHDGCSASHVAQEVWTEGTLINAQVLSEETEATESPWLPKVKQKLAGLFILFASSRVALCVLSTKRVLQTQTTFLGFCCYFWWVWSHPSPTPKLLLLAGSLTNHISRGQALSHGKIINYLIKNSQLKAEFSLRGREKVTGGDAVR